MPAICLFAAHHAVDIDSCTKYMEMLYLYHNALYAGWLKGSVSNVSDLQRSFHASSPVYMDIFTSTRNIKYLRCFRVKSVRPEDSRLWESRPFARCYPTWIVWPTKIPIDPQITLYVSPYSLNKRGPLWCSHQKLRHKEVHLYIPLCTRTLGWTAQTNTPLSYIMW